jgi:poly(3-hydroxybutyrate) depolymerase
MLIGLTVNAQTIDLHGKISNQAGNPIANAIITLTVQGLKDTTGGDGTYSITTKTASKIPLLVPQSENISLCHGGLAFGLSKPSMVKIQIFDINGTLLKKESLQNVSTGFYRFDIAENTRTTRLLIIKATVGQTEMTFSYLPLSNNKYAANSTVERSGMPVSSRLAKINAINDTLTISAAGYAAKTIAIESYEQQLNITLDTAAGGSTGSAGCGKALSTLKNGTYKITSASLNREYIIDIPADYDPDKPYRLIFGMHCMGSSMQGVVGEKYYSLKPLAEKANIPCIFVAPQGYTDNSPWRVSDNKDHTFFGDMLKLFKEELCIDTTRIFCCGFSYGAMVSYSLSLDFAKQLRAVATYAPANWNIWLPTITHDPIAYYQTTGTGDNLCSWVNSDAKKQGGKYCVLQHIEDNGCTVPATIPTATSSKHVSTEFSGCKEGYPVKFGSHNGGHQGTASDQGSSENWIAKETWEFFMQF